MNSFEINGYNYDEFGNVLPTSSRLEPKYDNLFGLGKEAKYPQCGLKPSQEEGESDADFNKRKQTYDACILSEKAKEPTKTSSTDWGGIIGGILGSSNNSSSGGASTSELLQASKGNDSSKTNTAIIIGIIAVVLVAIVVTVVLVTKKK